LALILFAIGIGHADARHPHKCSTALNLKNMLDLQFDETVRYGGIAGELITKLYLSQKGSWTLVFMGQNGTVACIMAGGEKWHEVPWEPGKKT